MKFAKTSVIAMLALGLALVAGGCSKKGQEEAAGEEVTQAAEKAGGKGAKAKAGKEPGARPGEKVVKAPRKGEHAAKAAPDQAVVEVEPAAGEPAVAPELPAEPARPAPDKPQPAPAVAPAPEAAPQVAAVELPVEAPPAAHPSPTPPRPAVAAGDSQVVVLDDQPLDLAAFVDAETVRRLLKAQSLTAQETLAGVLPSREYNAVRFHDPRTTTLGVAVQVWRFSTLIETRRKYDQFAAHYPDAQATDAVGTLGFFASSADILHIGFLEQTKKTLVLLSASQDAGNAKNLYLLAKEILRRL